LFQLVHIEIALVISVGQKSEILVRHGLVLDEIQDLEESGVVDMLDDQDDIRVHVMLVGKYLVHRPADPTLLMLQILEPVAETQIIQSGGAVARVDLLKNVQEILFLQVLDVAFDLGGEHQGIKDAPGITDDGLDIGNHDPVDVLAVLTLGKIKGQGIKNEGRDIGKGAPEDDLIAVLVPDIKAKSRGQQHHQEPAHFPENIELSKDLLDEGQSIPRLVPEKTDSV
jgi:hypothetical protein